MIKQFTEEQAEEITRIFRKFVNKKLDQVVAYRDSKIFRSRLLHKMDQASREISVEGSNLCTIWGFAPSHVDQIVKEEIERRQGA